MTSITHSPPFEFSGSTNYKRLAIEASAGTGKTFTLAGLTTLFVAENDIPLDQILIVTFTRAATNELRSRVRMGMVNTLERVALKDPRHDPIAAHLLANPDPRHESRLRRAIADFDSANITTIHGFATQVLRTLGSMSEVDPDVTLVDDTDELALETCTDLIASLSIDDPAPHTLPPVDSLARAARKILSTPGMNLIPSVGVDGIDPRSHRIHELACKAAEMIISRRESAATMSFDDILVRLQQAIQGSGASTVIESLRSRFRAALIDEFQDTDPIQWSIFDSLFGTTGTDSSLVLVGDPKQAIYSFRGADIATYLDAVGSPDDSTKAPGSTSTIKSLTTNWRSDGAMLDALDLLLDGSTFGDQSIAFKPVQPAPSHTHTRMLDAHGLPVPPLTIGLAVGDSISRTKTGRIQVDAARQAIFENLTQHVGNLLAGATIPSEDNPDRRRRVKPSDIAVLVLKNDDAESIRESLVRNGIPAVLARGSSVLNSGAAEQWSWLLSAMSRPSDPTRARAFALGWFGGHTSAWLLSASDEQIEAIQEMLKTWADTLARSGFASAFGRIKRDTGVAARLLATPEGDRNLTDIDHVAQLLHSAHAQGALGPASLLEFISRGPDIDGDTENDSDITSRRVETDEESVQIMTVWVSKGLEFPIVCAPTMWTSRRSPGELIYHDSASGHRTFDVASCLPGAWSESPRAWPDKRQTESRRNLAIDEAAAESLRLLYVALTRARHHTALWWSHSAKTDKSPLSRVLFGRAEGHLDPELFSAPAISLPPDDRLVEVLRPTIELSGGNIEVTAHGAEPASVPDWKLDRSDSTLKPLEIATLHRPLDRSGGRWSFSAIVARSDHVPDPTDASLSDRGSADEHPLDEHLDGSQSRLVDGSMLHTAPAEPPKQPSPLASLPAGPAFGTLVHEVLEEIDFTSAALTDNLHDAIADRTKFTSIDLRPRGPALLAEGLEAAVDTPLGPLFEGLRLRDIPRADRLDELSFELPLGRAGHHPSDREVGALIADHLTDADPLAEWASAMASGMFDVQLCGHLTGSIDAVVRVSPADQPPQFVVVDYKSNRLHSPGADPLPNDYGRESMARAMEQHHYGLQALLYQVAVHRYLRWRLAGYSAAEHLGGAAYLFVRGMTGADVPVRDAHPDGVFSWSVAPELITNLSDLLDGKIL